MTILKGPPAPPTLPPRSKKNDEATGSTNGDGVRKPRSFRPTSRGGGIFACAKKRKGFDGRDF